MLCDMSRNHFYSCQYWNRVLRILPREPGTGRTASELTYGVMASVEETCKRIVGTVQIPRLPRSISNSHREANERKGRFEKDAHHMEVLQQIRFCPVPALSFHSLLSKCKDHHVHGRNHNERPRFCVLVLQCRRLSYLNMTYGLNSDLSKRPPCVDSCSRKFQI